MPTSRLCIALSLVFGYPQHDGDPRLLLIEGQTIEDKLHVTLTTVEQSVGNVSMVDYPLT